jgi:hypothetical protein
VKFFKDTTPMTTTTGSDILREATRIRIKKGHAAPLARDLKIGTAALETFATGGARLPDAIMTALAKDLLGSNVEFDAERNLLKRAEPVTTPMGIRPPPYQRTAPVRLGPSHWPPVTSDTPPPAQPKVRPGWAD